MPIQPGTFGSAPPPKPRPPQPQNGQDGGTGPPIRRVVSIFLTDDILESAYEVMLGEDAGVTAEAIAAYEEMQLVPFDDLDDDMKKEEETDGLVQRRAPLNPLRSPLMGKFRKGKRDKKDKVSDPALQKNPLRGRLLITFMTTSALLLVFFQALVFNKVETGRFHAKKSKNGMFGPDPMVLFQLGGLNANEIRKGEVFRIFWAMWMHSGWLHIGFNIVCQIQFLWMLEPDWGSVRTLLLFFVAGITGNLLSANCDPCSTTVGSSGALFGLMGGMLPYCIEYWKSIPRPGLILVFSMLVLVISVLTGFTGSTDNWAHMGGMLGGVLFGLGTLTTLTACEDMDCRRFFPWFESSSSSAHRALDSPRDGKIVGPDGKQRKKVVKRNPVARLFQKKIRPSCKCGIREWIVRGIALILLIVTWVILFKNLLVSYEFQPPGHVTYSRIRECCCCYYDSGSDGGTSLYEGQSWTCNYCDAPLSGGKGTWQSKCNARSSVEAAEVELDELLDAILNSDFENGISEQRAFLSNVVEVKNVARRRELGRTTDSTTGVEATEDEHPDVNWSGEVNVLEQLMKNNLLSKDVRTKVTAALGVLESSKAQFIDGETASQLDTALTKLVNSVNQYITNDFDKLETDDSNDKPDGKVGSKKSKLSVDHSNSTMVETRMNVFSAPKILNSSVKGSLVGEEDEVFANWESIYNLWKEKKDQSHGEL